MYIKKSLLAAASALAITVAASSSATAGPSYDFALKLKGQNQINYVQAIIKNYSNTIPLFKRLKDQYGHYPWAKVFVTRYEMMVNEVALLQSIIDNRKEAIPTPVGEEIVWSQEFDVVKTGTEKLVDTHIKQVEDEANGMVKVYDEITRMYERSDTVRRYRGRVIYTIYSNGERVPLVKPLQLSINTVVEKREETERKFVREYAVVVEPQEDDNQGTVTAEILTVDEYHARDDVNYGGTQAYQDAVLSVNPNIGHEYINDRMTAHGNNLAQIGAPDAWARGWTGKGSTIAILDTGIDLDHTEFADSIAGTKCFTRECKLGYATIQDENRYSHGTHVAGIAAGNLDGNGSTGVAPDADLLIAKTAYNSGFFDFTVVDEAIEWAVENGAVVANISANYNIDNVYKKSMTEIAPGMFRSSDTRGRNGITYDNYGYSNLYSTTEYYKDIVDAMKGNELVLVMAAGNQRLKFAGQPTLIALDDEVGDRVLVVGNWDGRQTTLGSSSNGAGTVCFDFNETTQTCNNDKRISDRFLLAPGQWIMSADKDGEYRTNSGTSMAAPAVSGAVAVVHQMWPHMTGANISKLLLDTASTDEIWEYDVNLHGQGLLDLDEATLPQGVIGIPTTGRIDGVSSSVSSVTTMSIAGASISALDNMMVVDDYDRDFYVDGNRMNTGAVSMMNYTDVADVTVPMENIKMHLGNNASGIEANYNGVMLGMMSESNTFLGNSADNMLIDIDGATTAYAGYETQYTTGNTTLFGSASLGITQLDVNNSAMMKSASSMISNSAKLGVRQKVGDGVFNFTTELPVAITNGQGTFDVASSVSASGDIESTQMTSSLANASRELKLGIGYDYAITDNAGIGTFANFTDNAGSISGNTSTEVGFNFRVLF